MEYDGLYSERTSDLAVFCICINLSIDWSFDYHVLFSNTGAYKFCVLLLGTPDDVIWHRMPAKVHTILILHDSFWEAMLYIDTIYILPFGFQIVNRISALMRCWADICLFIHFNSFLFSLIIFFFIQNVGFQGKEWFAYKRFVCCRNTVDV